MPKPDPLSDLDSATGAAVALPFRRPWLLILLAACMAGFGGYVYLFELEIHSGRRQLSNLESPLNRRYEAYRQDFGVESSIVLVVTAEMNSDAAMPGPSARAGMKQVAKDWAMHLRARANLFPEVTERISAADMGPLALLYFPEDVFAATLNAMRSGVPILAEWAKNPSLQSLFTLITARLGQLGASDSKMSEATLTAVVAQAEAFFDWFDGELGSDQTRADLATLMSSSLGVGEFDAEGYMFVDEGRMLLVVASLRGDNRQSNEYALPIEGAWEATESALANLGEDSSISAGIAGLPALDYEEMVTSQGDFARGAIISLVLVTGLFMWAFHTLKRPTLAALCLCMAIGMTFVFTWLAVGHLNLVAMVFVIILVVLGIDFAIHYTTHYERALVRVADPAVAGTLTLGRIGGALWMGGLTTVVAFLSAGFTEAPGFAELGIIAGGGLLICLVMMIVVYPAMLYLVDRRNDLPGMNRSRVRDDATEPIPVPNLAMRAVCAVAVMLSLFGLWRGQYHFDTNLLLLQPAEGRAALWQNRLLEADDRTQFAIATYPDRNSLDVVRRRFDAMPELVRSTQSAFPDHEVAKRRELGDIAGEFEQIVWNEPELPSPRNLRRALFGMRTAVRKLSASSTEAEQGLARIVASLDRTYQRLRSTPDQVIEPRLRRVQGEVLAVARSAHAELQTLCSPPPTRLDLIPTPLRRRFVGVSGDLALMVYPVANTWDPQAREAFVTAATKVEPELFGGVVSFSHNAQTMVESFALASLYSLSAVLALILVWSRSLRVTALALFPLMVAIGLLLGIMRYAPWPLSWNFANFFALPILIGVGVDSGIHLLRAYRDDAAAFMSARRAVLVSTLTTLIGFGILSTSQHLGVRSLGTILTIGISLVLFTSLLLMPVVLHVFLRSEHPADA